MKFLQIENHDIQSGDQKLWLPENIIEIEKKNLHLIVEKINRQSRYPLLAVRIFIHVLTHMDTCGRVCISARQLSKSLGAHYDTVTKCLKYLREIGVLSLDK